MTMKHSTLRVERRIVQSSRSNKLYINKYWFQRTEHNLINIVVHIYIY